MKKVLNKNNFIFILILMTLFNLIMPTISYAANVSINDMMKETVAGWYAILKALVVGAMIVLVLIIALKAAITKRSSDTALVKSMLKDWIVALLLIFFIDYFMIFAIEINEAAVAGAEQIGQKLSGMKEGQEISLYESVFTKAYEIKFKPGTIGMILYIMLVYYAYKFTLVYLKRYINVIVLIITAPIICGFHAFKKVITGKAITLKKWFKEFIYNVFLQSLHAIMYGSLVGLTLKFSEDGESFIGAILTMIIFAVIFKVDKLVRKLFNKIGGDTSIAVSKIDSTVSNAISTSKQVGSNQMGSLAGNGNIFNQENEYGGWIDNKINNRFGEDLKFGMVTDGIKSDTKNGWMSLQNDFRTGKDNLKDTFSDISGTIKGEHKQVSEEAIAREQEKMDNAGFFGKAWHTMLTMPGIISEKVNKKSEELRLYLETKKNETINNIQTLQRDVQTIKAIPKLIKSVRKMPESVVMTQNPVTKQLEYDEKYEALIDFDVDTEELEERIISFIHMSLGQISTAVVLAQGYEALLHSPKLGMMMLAEQNYKDMVHPEIPYEERRIVAGFKHEIKPRLKFKRFENGAIDTIEQVVIMDATQVFAGLRTLKRVGAAVRNQTISYRSVPDGAETTTVRFTGKADASKKMYSNIQLTLQGLRTFRSDVQIARNINLLNEIQNIENRNMLSNLTPEMLVTLERAGIAIKVPENGDFSGGYIILNHALDNAIMINRIENYLSTNEGTPMAQTLNQFLLNNPENEVAIKISNYLIDNPDSVLVSLINDVEVTEDGRLIKRIDSFTMDGQIPVLSQLGVINENTIVQTIITEEGEIVEQVIDLQGNIVSPATDEQGNIVEFPTENGRVLQTIVTPDGNLMQQLVSSDGTKVKPIIINDLITEKTFVEQFDNISEIITEIITPNSEIQVIKKDGSVEVLDLEFDNIQIIQNEDGTISITEKSETKVLELESDNIQIIQNEDGTVLITEKSETKVLDLKANNVQIVQNEDGITTVIYTETKKTDITINKDEIIQVINPEEATIQVFDLKNNTVETAYGEVAVQVLKEKGITLSPEQEVEFKEREELKSILTEISDASAVDLETGEIENIVELRQETEILTALTTELGIQETEVPTEEEQMSKLNNLLDQISEAQSIELTTSLFENMEEEREKVLVEVGVKDLDNPKLLQQVAEYSTVTSSVYTDEIATYQLDETVGMISSNKAQSAENTDYEANDPFLIVEEILSPKKSEEKVETNSTSENLYTDLTISEWESDDIDTDVVTISERENDGTDTLEKILNMTTTEVVDESIIKNVVESIDSSIEEMSTQKSDTSNILESILEKKTEKVERGTAKSKLKKAQKNTSEEDNSVRIIKIRIYGAVNKPGEYKVRFGSRVHDVVTEAGKLSDKVDKEKYALIADKIINENNTDIHIPEISQTEDKKENEKDKDKDISITNTNKITIYLTGEGVLVLGKKELDKGITIGNLITNFKSNANKDDIEVNNQKVSMQYKLRDKDMVYVPIITDEELDRRRNIDVNAVKDAIRIEVERHKEKNSQKENDIEILQYFLDNEVILKQIVKDIIVRLNNKKIKLSNDEVIRRLKDYLEEEIKRLKLKSRSKSKSIKLDSKKIGNSDLFEQISKELAFIPESYISIAKKQKEKREQLSYENIEITEENIRIINEMMKFRKSMGTN